MAFPESIAAPFYLAIEGQQTGPFTEQEMCEKIAKGEVPRDALIWYDGMPEWQSFLKIPRLKESFQVSPMAMVASLPTQSEGRPEKTVVAEGLATPPPPDNREDTDTEHSERAGTKAGEYTVEATQASITDKSEITQLSEESSDSNDGLPDTPEESSFPEDPSHPAPPEVPNEPVFNPREAAFSDPFFLRNRMKILIFGVFVVVGSSWGIFVWKASKQQATEVVDPAAKLLKAISPKKTREEELSKALSELKIKSSESLLALSKLISLKPDDRVAEEAVRAAVDHYRLMRQPAEAGKILMAAKRPLEASEYFLQDPPSPKEAQQALFQAFEKESNFDKKYDLLTRNIALLLSPLNNMPLAMERIKLLSVQFPKKSHPYGYYLKASEDKIVDLFARLSHYFVENLISYIEQQLPQIRLEGRPVVKINKDSQLRYRIMGSYKGPISLSQDKITDMFLTFWLWNDQWYLTDTNLTPERKRWADNAKKKLETNSLSTAATLQFLETLFRTQFPKVALHESLNPDKLNLSKTSSDD